METTQKETLNTHPERRYDIDWLRVLAILTVFLFHCARFFNEEDWHVKNPQLDPGMSFLVWFLSIWIMPLFFVLSAMSAFYSLERRTALQFLKSRVTRLVVPLVVGILTHVSLQVYLERISHSQYEGSFFSFYPAYFEGLYGFGGNFAWMGLHLWYLEMLFIFSVITVPLLLFFKKRTSESMARPSGLLLRKPGAIFTLILPIAVLEFIVGLDPQGIGRRDFGGWSLLTYLVLFLIGFKIAADKELKGVIERRRWPALMLGVIAAALSLYTMEFDLNLSPPLRALLRASFCWSWLVAILGWSSRYFRRGNRFLVYANEAVLPFYILHQTIIVAIAFTLINWPVGVWPKYVVLAPSSFLCTVLFYDLLVRRWNVTRFLFGMKRNSR